MRKLLQLLILPIRPYPGFVWILLMQCLGIDCWAAQDQLRVHAILQQHDKARLLTSALTDIAQDKQGFIWLASEYGLARFDGRDLKLYQTSSAPNSLPSNSVRDLLADNQGHLWLATDLGLARYQPETDSFTTRRPAQNAAFTNLTTSAVTALAEDHKHNLLVGTALGLSVLAKEDDTFYDIPLPNAAGTMATPVQAMTVDSQDRVWVGTRDHGLYLLNLQRDIVRHYEADTENALALQSNSIKSIAEDPFGRIWVGTYGGGMSRLQADGQSFQHYSLAQTSGEADLASVWDIFVDSSGYIWAASDRGGVALYDPEGDQFMSHTLNSSTKINNQVRKIYEDNQGNLWLATFPSGLVLYLRSQRAVTNIVVDGEANSNVVTAFLDNDTEALWVATESGLNRLNKTTLRWSDVPAKFRLAGQSVLALEQGKHKELWIGTWSKGLYRLEGDGLRLTQYTPDRQEPKSLNSAFVWALYRDKSGQLWVGTETGGLNLFHPESNSFTSYRHDQKDPNSLSSNFVRALLEDSRGRFWVATGNGVDIFDRQSGKALRISQQPISETDFTLQGARGRALLEDSKQRIWIGTQERGVYWYDEDLKRFVQVAWPQSLSPLVSGLLEDQAGYIWAATPDGLGRIDPQTGLVSSFTEATGLVGDNFHRGALHLDANGTIYVGGTRGVSVINPDRLVTANSDYATVLTGFKLMQPTSSPSQHQRVANHSNELVLNAKHKGFELTFATLNYAAASEIQYAYKLEGFDKDWNFNGRDNRATYTNLGPGEYLFKVKSANRDGTWYSTQLQVPITVLAPLWRSQWAYLIYVLVFVLAIYLLLNKLVGRHTRQLHQWALPDSTQLRLSQYEYFWQWTNNDLEPRSSDGPFGEVDLHNCVASACNAASPLALERKVTLNNFVADEVKVIADRQMINWALMSYFHAIFKVVTDSNVSLKSIEMDEGVQLILTVHQRNQTKVLDLAQSQHYFRRAGGEAKTIDATSLSVMFAAERPAQ